jgi:hypothetical protein
VDLFKLNEIGEFRKTLDEETDRGVALMSAAFLEGELETLLREYFINDKAVVGEFFSFNGSCGTFSSKIDMCYLLGLIGKRARRDFHLIRKIRNDFGHTATPLSFESQQISNRCKELYYDAVGIDVSPRVKFTRVAVGILAFIHGAYFQMKKCTPGVNYEISEEIKKEAQIAYNELKRQIESEKAGNNKDTKEN